MRTGAPWGFRLRARLAVRGRATSPKIGIFAEGSHRVVDIPRCLVHHPLINDVAHAVKSAIRRTGAAPYADEPHRGLVRYLQVAVERATQTAQVVVVTNDESPESAAPLFDALQRDLGDRLHSLFWNGNTARANTILGPRFHRLYGPEALRERIGDVNVFYPPGAFGQSNTELAAVMTEHVRSAVPPGVRVAELYAGTGAIGLGLLARAEEVVFNEISEGSIRGLELGLDDLHPSLSSKAKVIAGPSADHADIVDRADVVIVDPPRRGLDEPLILRLCQRPPKSLIYVACGVDSFGRDADILLGCGHFDLVELTPFHLFPYTDHVEVVAQFARSADPTV